MIKIALIAAMERELLPLVRSSKLTGWKQSALECDGRRLRCYERDGLVAVAGGIGCSAAQKAAEAVVKEYRPQMLVSAGLAGALIRSLKVGSVIVPNVMIDARSGAEYRCSLGEGVVGGGILVSATEVAGADAKQKLVEEFHALAVDMEAAGVAEVARKEQIGFRCVKAISDESDFVMPRLEGFMNAQGEFQTSRFALWAAVRPMQWPGIYALARNSSKAAKALCQWLEQHVASDLKPASVSMLAKAEAV